MSSKLKVILMTVVCTTIGWAVLIFGVLWYFSTQSDVVMAPLVDTGTGQDYCGIFSITNRDSHPVRLFLEELQTKHN